MSTGLVLGKFAPLHHGHQLLIESSLAETDETVVLIYDCPGLEVPPLPVRVAWINRLYPQVRVLEAWDGPTQTGLAPEITAAHDAYLRNRLSGLKITHFFSSEPYGDHVSRALGAIDRRVDMARNRFHISATEIRRDPFLNRAFLSPQVYRDLVMQVVFLGAPSTGKTTLAQAMAERMGTVWMPEYGREYWEKNQVDRRLSLEQLLEIAEGHRCREDALVCEARKYFFIDTDASTTLQFSKMYHDTALPQLEVLAAESRERYDLFFLCEPDIPYDDTWDRSGDVNRQVMHRRIEADLKARRVPFVRLLGPLDERCRQVTEVLEGYKKYAGG